MAKEPQHGTEATLLTDSIKTLKMVHVKKIFKKKSGRNLNHLKANSFMSKLRKRVVCNISFVLVVAFWFPVCPRPSELEKFADIFRGHHPVTSWEQSFSQEETVSQGSGSDRAELRSSGKARRPGRFKKKFAFVFNR